jgi:hypothetical protein
LGAVVDLDSLAIGHDQIGLSANWAFNGASLFMFWHLAT